MTNRCIRICFTASDKFNLITRDKHAFVVVSLALLAKSESYCRRLAKGKLQGSEVTRNPWFKTVKIQGKKSPGFWDLNIPEYEHPWRTVLARLRIAAFYFLASAPEVTWRRYLSRFLSRRSFFKEISTCRARETGSNLDGLSRPGNSCNSVDPHEPGRC